MRVEVKPELLRWAAERAGLSAGVLARRVPQFSAWERGEAAPTLKQLERFAQATHAPVGYLFLPQPPVERVPIPDFRTLRAEQPARPSPDLLDTLYICQQRQEWYRDFARASGEERLAFVGSARVTDDVDVTAASMRAALGFDLEARRQMPTWTDALRRFIEQADALGVLVMVSGVVGSNNRRKLDPDEFRGFTLSDPVAPLVFINGADTKAAQMFTLAHEMAHIWLGESALSDAAPGASPTHRVERWCNQGAAELLVPSAALRTDYRPDSELSGEMLRLAGRFKVSSLEILRRLHDAGALTPQQFWAAYEAEVRHLRGLRKGSGGDFYLTLGARVGKRFARALVASTLEGRSSFTEAFRLLGFRKMATFRDLGRSLGVQA
jgi:Zn-dependent peptidase ImmA (M78 family)/transcriptional regulator with XRE-family HTH domain